MPRKKIIPRYVLHNGKWRWRVIIPIENGGGKSFFVTKKEALEFAAEEEAKRRGAINELYGISENLAKRVIGALEILHGREDEIEKAAAFYVAHNIRETRTLEQAIAECIDRKRTAGRRAISNDNSKRRQKFLARTDYWREEDSLHPIKPANAPILIPELATDDFVNLR